MTTMSRDDQRALGVLLSTSRKKIEAGESTLAVTMHATADQLDWLVVIGGTTFRDYPAKERRRMAKEGRALPDGSFPIADCSDAEDAIRSIGRAKPGKRADAERHIKKRVRALRCDGPIFQNWK